MKLPKLGLAISLLLLLSVAAIPANAQDISGFNWIGTVRNGPDPFYGGNVVAYQTGDTATLAINFGVAPGDSTVNVTKVTVSFDWGVNYTSIGVPSIINPGVLRTFTITFTVPPTATATNLVIHSYNIFVEFKNVPSTGMRARTVSGSNFVVYSTDQASTMKYMQRLGGPTGSGYVFSTFHTSQASALAAQAASEANLGQSLYSSGDFANAKVHLANANNLLGNATSIEQSKSAALDLSIITAGYGSLLLGIGATLFGIAALLYLVQRRRLTHITAVQATSTSR